jgi:hypothetical protein
MSTNACDVCITTQPAGVCTVPVLGLADNGHPTYLRQNGICAPPNSLNLGEVCITNTPPLITEDFSINDDDMDSTDITDFYENVPKHSSDIPELRVSFGFSPSRASLKFPHVSRAVKQRFVHAYACSVHLEYPVRDDEIVVSYDEDTPEYLVSPMQEDNHLVSDRQVTQIKQSIRDFVLLSPYEMLISGDRLPTIFVDATLHSYSFDMDVLFDCPMKNVLGTDFLNTCGTLLCDTIANDVIVRAEIFSMYTHVLPPVLKYFFPSGPYRRIFGDPIVSNNVFEGLCANTTSKKRRDLLIERGFPKDVFVYGPLPETTNWIFTSSVDCFYFSNELEYKLRTLFSDFCFNPCVETFSHLHLFCRYNSNVSCVLPRMPSEDVLRTIFLYRCFFQIGLPAVHQTDVIPKSKPVTGGSMVTVGHNKFSARPTVINRILCCVRGGVDDAGDTDLIATHQNSKHSLRPQRFVRFPCTVENAEHQMLRNVKKTISDSAEVASNLAEATKVVKTEAPRGRGILAGVSQTVRNWCTVSNTAKNVSVDAEILVDNFRKASTSLPDMAAKVDYTCGKVSSMAADVKKVTGDFAANSGSIFGSLRESALGLKVLVSKVSGMFESYSLGSIASKIGGFFHKIFDFILDCSTSLLSVPMDLCLKLVKKITDLAAWYFGCEEEKLLNDGPFKMEDLADNGFFTEFERSCSSEPEAEHQSLGSVIKVFTWFAGIVAFAVTGKYLGSKQLSELLRSISFLDRYLDAKSTIFSLIAGFANVLPEFVQSVLVKYVLPPEYGLFYVQFDKEWDELKSLTTSITDRYNSKIWEDPDHFASFKEDCEKWKNLYDVIYQAAIKVLGHKNDLKVFSVMHSIKKDMDNIIETVAATVSPTGPRRTPFVVWLYGDPGVGKSMLLYSLAKYLIPGIRDNEIVTYEHKGENGFWDNFKSYHRVTIIDDFGKDTTTLSDLCDEFQSMVSCNEYIVNKASLAEKGARFNCELILVASNSFMPVPSTRIDTEAMFRRRDLVINVQLRPEYGLKTRSCTLANGKMISMSPRAAFFPHHQYYIMDPFDDNHRFSGDLDYCRIAAGAYDMFHKHLDKQNVLLKSKLGSDNFQRITVRDFDLRLRNEEVPPGDFHSSLEEMVSSHFKVDNVRRVLLEREALVEQIKIARQCVEEGVGLDTYYDSDGQAPVYSSRFEKMKDVFSSFRDNCEGIFRMCVEKVKSYITEHYGLILVGVGSISAIGYVLYRYFNSRNGADHQSWHFIDGEWRWIAKKGAPSRKAKFAPKHPPRFGKVKHQTFEESKWRDREVFISIGGQPSRCLFVEDSMIMLPAHAARIFKHGDTGFVRYGERELPLVWDTERLLIEYIQKPMQNTALYSPSLAYYKLPESVSGVRSMVGWCASATDHAHFSGTIDCTQLKKDDYRTTTAEYTGYGFRATATHTETEIIEGAYVVNDVNAPGDCGNIIVNVQGRLFGMHVAGVGDGRCIFAPVVKDDLVYAKEYFIDAFGKPFAQLNTATKLVVSHQTNEQKGALYRFGDTKPVYSAINSSTKLVKSKMYEGNEFLYPNKSGPSPKTAEDSRITVSMNGSTVMGLNYDHMSVQTGGYLRATLRAAASNTLDAFSAGTKLPVPARVLTIDEALNGGPNIDAMVLNTSAGFFGIRNGRRGAKKSDFITGEPGERKCSALLEKTLQVKEDLFKQGIVSGNYFMDHLKDERLPITKVEQGKCRLFSCDDLPNVILSKRYFGAFANYVIANYLDVPCSIGMDPASFDWHDMVTRLSMMSKKIVAADYKKYDKRLPAEVIHEAIYVVNEWYARKGVRDEVADQVRACLLVDLINSIHVSPEGVFQTSQGMPSGHYLTAIINSVCNAIMFREAYVVLTGKPAYTYVNNVVDYYHGDDNALAVKDDVIDVFNLSTIAQHYKKHNLILTSPAKIEGEVLAPYVDLLDFEYISCTNSWNEDLSCYAPRLKDVAFKGAFNWVRRCELTEFQVIDGTFTNFQFYRFWFGKHDFEKWTRQMLETMRTTYGQQPTVVYTYSELKKRYQEGGRSGVTQAVHQSDTPEPPVSVDATADEPVIENPTVETVDVPVPPLVSQERVGVTFEEGEEQEDKDFPGFRHAAPSFQSDTWSIEQTLCRWTTTSVSWKSTDTEGKQLLALAIPGDVIADNITKIGIENFVFWRGNLRVRVSINGTRFHQGMLRIVYDPLVAKESREVAGSKVNMSLLRGVSLMPNEPKTKTFSCPYLSTQDYIKRDHNIGTLRVIVFNQLKAGSKSSSELNVIVATAFDNPETQIPSITRHLPDRLDEVQHQSEMLCTGDSVVTDLVKSFIPPNIVGDALSMLPMLFDKPLNPINSSVVIDKKMSYTANSKGFDNSQSFAMDMKEMNLSTKAHFQSNDDEMSFNYLHSIPTFLQKITVKTTDLHGNILAKIPITPIQNLPLDDVPRHVTLLTYNAVPFQYWKGGLKLRLEFIKTSIHRMRLGVFWMYHPTSRPAPDAPTFESLKNTYHHIIDVAEGTTGIDLQFPFAYEKPWCNTQLAGGIGEIYFVVLNKLASIGDIASSIDINVYLSGAPDFRVHWLKNDFEYEPVRHQSDDCPVPVAINPGQDHFLEAYVSWQQCGKRFSHVKLPVVQQPSTDTYAVVHDPVPLASLLSVTGANKTGIIGYAAGMYRLARGGLRVKYPGNDANSSIVVYEPERLEDDTRHRMESIFNSGAYAMGPADYSFGDRIHEISIPFVTGRRSILVSSDSGELRSRHDDLGYLCFLKKGFTKMGTNEDLLVAFTDEFRFGCLYRVPQLKVGTIVAQYSEEVYISGFGVYYISGGGWRMSPWGDGKMDLPRSFLPITLGGAVSKNLIDIVDSLGLHPTYVMMMYGATGPPIHPDTVPFADAPRVQGPFMVGNKTYYCVAQEYLSIPYENTSGDPRNDETEGDVNTKYLSITGTNANDRWRMTYGGETRQTTAAGFPPDDQIHVYHDLAAGNSTTDVLKLADVAKGLFPNSNPDAIVFGVEVLQNEYVPLNYLNLGSTERTAYNNAVDGIEDGNVSKQIHDFIDNGDDFADEGEKHILRVDAAEFTRRHRVFDATRNFWWAIDISGTGEPIGDPDEPDDD